MPISSSFCVMTSLSSTEKEMDSPCVPSRRVVSKVKIFMRTPYPRLDTLCHRDSYFFLLFQKRHHLAQFLADFFDRLVLGGLAHREKLLAAGLVLFDPLPREFAGLDLGQNLLHLG